MKRILVAVSVVALTTAVAASAGSPSPKALYNALLVSPVKGVTPTPTRPGSSSRRHHVVGELLINFNGGHSRIAYVVLPTHADALGNYADGIRALKKIRSVRKVEKSVPGLPKPSVLVDASQSGIGVTQISFIFDNVEIAAQSIRLQAKSGNEKLARSLAVLALEHLRSVEKSA
jgi:hypothetical protein